MQIIDNKDATILGSVLLSEPYETKQSVMAALLRGQPIQPQPFQPPAGMPPMVQPQAPQQQGGATGSWDAPPQQPRQPMLRQALAAQAQRGPVGPAAAPQIPPPPQGPQMDEFAVRDAALQKQHEAAIAEMNRATQPPDASAMNAMAEQRREHAGRQMLTALAAQHAGPGYEAVQRHYLQAAGEADAPMKMSGGTLTSQGWLADPGHTQMMAVRQAEARVGAIERAQQSNISAAERRRLEADRQQAAADLKQAQLSLQSSIAQQASADRRYMADLSHADRQAAAAAKAGPGTGKILPAKTVTDLTEGQQKASDVIRLAKEFRPEFGGVEGWGANVAGKIPFVTTAAAEWWKNYKKEDELITRHGLFGASLTEGEKASWREADIDPSMHPSAIARNLERRQQIIDQKYRGLVKNYGVSGYNTEAFQVPDMPAQVQPPGGAGGGWAGPAGSGAKAPGARVTSDADYAKLPSGTTFIAPDGKIRRKP